MSRVNIVKRIKLGGRWKMFSIPRNAKGNYDWNAIADASSSRKPVSRNVVNKQDRETLCQLRKRDGQH